MIGRGWSEDDGEVAMGLCCGDGCLTLVMAIMKMQRMKERMGVSMMMKIVVVSDEDGKGGEKGWL